MIKLRKAETVFVGAIQNDSEILFTQVGIVFLFFPPWIDNVVRLMHERLCMEILFPIALRYAYFIFK